MTEALLFSAARAEMVDTLTDYIKRLPEAERRVITLAHASEVAGRVVDRAVQILGGRGYMRENPVERLSRDLRVDRIWEGTSEIQRAIIGGQIRKRGLGVFTGWP